MKTISGSILSSKPITLSKAASSMNKFLSIETGASTAVSSYLRRSAAAFNELVQFHKELKGVRSERKHKDKKSRLETFENVKLLNAAAEEIHEENCLAIAERGTDLGEVQSVRYPENSGLGSVDEEGRTTERKKKKKRKKSDQIDEVETESGGHCGIEVEEIKEKEKKKKKRKKPEIEDECLDDSEERHRMKKKKRKHEMDT